MFGRKKDAPAPWPSEVVSVDLVVERRHQGELARLGGNEISTQDMAAGFLDGDKVIVVAERDPIGTLPPRLTKRIIASPAAAAAYAEGVDVPIEIRFAGLGGRRVIAQVTVPVA